MRDSPKGFPATARTLGRRPAAEGSAQGLHVAAPVPPALWPPSASASDSPPRRRAARWPAGAVPAAQARTTGLALRGCPPLSSAQARRAGCPPCSREYVNQGCVMRPAGIRARCSWLAMRVPGWSMRGSDRGSTTDPGRRPAVDESSLIFIIVPIAIPIALFTSIALPFIVASRSGRSHARGRLACAGGPERTSTTGRKARPPRPGAHDVPVEFLYVPCARIRYHGYSAGTPRWVQEVPIVKKTAKWIYYTSDTWDRRAAVVSPGCISRQEFQTDTRCHDNCPRDIAAGLVCARHGRGHRHCVHFLAPGRHCNAPGGCGEDCLADTCGVWCAKHGYTWDHCPHGEAPCRHGHPAGVIPIPGERHRPGPAGRLFFATREAAEDHLYRGEREPAEQAARQAPPIMELRRAMADAHPDRGGTAEQFVQAHRRYQTALQLADGNALTRRGPAGHAAPASPPTA